MQCSTLRYYYYHTVHFKYYLAGISIVPFSFLEKSLNTNTVICNPTLSAGFDLCIPPSPHPLVP